MPRIDPQQLLKCLSVLLSQNGGIKSKDEVQRLASLMTKFSKKLVSKCIYVSILKATETDLLIMFMSAGGWDLTYSWLSDGVAAKNWPLVTELVDLLLVCPVDIDRLKANACPKLIKTLSKDTSADEQVRLLACKLVEQWLRIVRGDNDVSTSKAQDPSVSVAVPQSVSSSSSPDVEEQDSTDVQDHDLTNDKCSVSDSEVKNDTADEPADGHIPVYKITTRDGKKVLEEISGGRRSSIEGAEEDGSTGTEDISQEDNEDHVEDEVDDEDDDDLIKPVKLRKKQPASKPKKQTVRRKPVKALSKEPDSPESSPSVGKSPNRPKDISKPTKKAKVESLKIKPSPKGKSNQRSGKVKESGNVKESGSVAVKEIEESISSKPKEKLSLSLKNRKTSASAKGKEKLENKAEGKSDKPDAKEKSLFDSSTLTDKEKETLSKFITPPISKVGKIPKKTSANKEEKQSEEKNRTLKEDNSPSDKMFDNKPEFKRSIDMKKPEIKRPEKKYSMSVEPKRSVPSDSRPKTVKTYNSKFRSTGLEEEIKPPPPRPIPKKLPSLLPPVLVVPDKKLSKRSSSPPPETHIPEKKPKPESPLEEKKSVEKVGGIKLIPPKPKRSQRIFFCRVSVGVTLPSQC